jgi:hypothetical protein
MRPTPAPVADASRFYPLSPRVLALSAGGLVTAIPPWWVVGSVASAVAHSVFGAALLTLGLWRVWRPVVAFEGDVLRYRPRLARGPGLTLPLGEVAELLPVPRTGHAPSERDLATWLGVRLTSGEVRWLDLGDLPASARREVRARLEAVAPG